MFHNQQCYDELKKFKREIEKKIYWTNLTEKEIERWLRKAYYSFYFRPSLILKTILRIRSLAELMRYIRVALRMLFFRSP